MENPRRTPLHDFHVAHGARMVDFAGWVMPVQYRSILEEHRAVRTAAGLFDVSHMGEIEVRGPGAGRFLDGLVTQDLGRLVAGRVAYTPLCGPEGGVRDDLLVYMRGPGDYLLCVNAVNRDADLAWIGGHAAGHDVLISDCSDQTALLAVQGPRALAIVQALADARLDSLGYYHFIPGRVGGVACLISRTGYTGEDGFELYHPPADSLKLAELLLAEGAPRGLVLCGLGARDSLRLEAGFPLHGHEISPEISPLAAGLGWTVKLGKAADFIGRAALLREKTEGSPATVRHFRTGDRRIARAGSAVLGPDGAPVGRILSGTLSPILNEAIGSALVASPAPATGLTTEIRGERVPLRIVKPPFVPLPKHGQSLL
jgi:aminomethyltransferase